MQNYWFIYRRALNFSTKTPFEIMFWNVIKLSSLKTFALLLSGAINFARINLLAFSVKDSNLTGTRALALHFALPQSNFNYQAVERTPVNSPEASVKRRSSKKLQKVVETKRELEMKTNNWFFEAEKFSARFYQRLVSNWIFLKIFTVVISCIEASLNNMMETSWRG